jgi:predicted acetyltransferase
MKNITRQLEGDEMLEALYALNQYSLHPSPPFQNKDEWMGIVRARKGVTCHATFEEATPVSIAVGTTMTQNMRGMLYPASGVWGVATHPSARRNGYCRQTIASLLSAERDSGKAFTNLYPFRESFYERLGYVSFPATKIAKLTPAAISPTLKMETGGEIDLKLIGDAYDTYREFLSQMRKQTHGMGFFDFGDRPSPNRNTFWVALAKFDGNTEGLMLYRVMGEEVTKFNFVSYRFYYRTSRARYLMLNWIARHVDQADRAEIWLSAEENPDLWLADIQVNTESAVRAAMSRVLDVERIGGMFVGEGVFSAQVIDPLCPWNEGAWKFEASGGKLQVTKTSKAECQLTVQGLTALIAGAHDPQDFSLRGWGDPNPELQSVLRRMFPRMRPFLHENF